MSNVPAAIRASLRGDLELHIGNLLTRPDVATIIADSLCALAQLSLFEYESQADALDRIHAGQICADLPLVEATLLTVAKSPCRGMMS